MKIGEIVTLGKAFAKENAPIILEVTSLVAGGLSVAAMGVGQHKADKKLAKMSDTEKDTLKKKIAATWAYYLPSLGLYGLSVACGIGSYKSEVAKYEAIIAGMAVSSGKADKLVDKAKEAVGIEPKKEDPDDKDKEKKVIFLEQPQWFYEPISGMKFRAKPSSIYASCIEAAQELICGSWVSVKDIIDGVDECEYQNDMSKAADIFGFDPEIDNCESLIPDITNGIVMSDGTACIKLTFNGRPHTKGGTTKREYFDN